MFGSLLGFVVRMSQYFQIRLLVKNTLNIFIYLHAHFYSRCNVFAFMSKLAQLQARSCRAPLLPNGFYVPQNEQYLHGQNLTYTCIRGSKAMGDVWWETSTCLDGEWYHKPECIGEFNRDLHLVQKRNKHPFKGLMCIIPN